MHIFVARATLQSVGWGFNQGEDVRKCTNMNGRWILIFIFIHLYRILSLGYNH